MKMRKKNDLRSKNQPHVMIFDVRCPENLSLNDCKLVHFTLRMSLHYVHF